MTRGQGEDEMDERRDHPLRVTLSELMHLRALPLDRAPVRLRQWVFLVEPSDRDAEATFVGLFAPGQDGGLGRAVRVGTFLWTPVGILFSSARNL